MPIDECPECRQKMDYGRIYSSGGIAWSPDPTLKKRQSLFPLEMLQKRPLFLISGFNGYRCKNCRIALFHYPKL